MNTDKSLQINAFCKSVGQKPDSETAKMQDALRLAEYRLESLLELSQMSWASVREIAD